MVSLKEAVLPPDFFNLPSSVAGILVTSSLTRLPWDRLYHIFSCRPLIVNRVLFDIVSPSISPARTSRREMPWNLKMHSMAITMLLIFPLGHGPRPLVVGVLPSFVSCSLPVSSNSSSLNGQSTVSSSGATAGPHLSAAWTEYSQPRRDGKALPSCSGRCGEPPGGEVDGENHHNEDKGGGKAVRDGNYVGILIGIVDGDGQGPDQVLEGV